MDYRVYSSLWIILCLHTGLVHLCSDQLTGRRGIITSPNFPSNYDNGLDCIWEIHPQGGGIIVLQFQEFEVYNCFDHLTIYDGQMKDADIIVDEVCGASLRHKTVISVTERVYILFHTSNYYRAKGFNLTWEACGGTFSAEEVPVTSPEIEFDFYHNGDFVCVFDLIIPEIMSAIVVNLTETEVDSNSGDCAIQILDNKGTQLGEVCRDTDSRVFISDTNEMRLNLRLTEANHVTMKAVFNTYECSQIYFNKTGIIQSPDYPTPFRRNSVCEYKLNFTIPETHLLHLNLTDINITCNDSDSLQILQLDPQVNNSAVELCTENTTNALYLSDLLVLRLSSSADPFPVRFSVYYSVVEKPVSLSSVPQRSSPKGFTGASLAGGIATGVVVIVVVAVVISLIHCRGRISIHHQRKKQKPTFMIQDNDRNYKGSEENRAREIIYANDEAAIQNGTGSETYIYDIDCIKNETLAGANLSEITATSHGAGMKGHANETIYVNSNYAGHEYLQFSSNSNTKGDVEDESDTDSIYKEQSDGEYDGLHKSREKIVSAKGDNFYGLSVEEEDGYDAIDRGTSQEFDQEDDMYDKAKRPCDHDDLYDKAGAGKW